MRDIETAVPKNAGVSTAETGSVAALDAEEYRKAKKQLQQVERAIEKLEEDIRVIGEDMGRPDFYQDPGHQKVLELYKKKQAELGERMEEWDVLVGLLG
jgi:hypothetical protein